MVFTHQPYALMNENRRQRGLHKGALKKTVGERIVRTRQRRGWSQAELARRLEVTRERLGKWERGATSPGLEELVWLSEVLQVPVWELGLGESPEEPLSS